MSRNLIPEYVVEKVSGRFKLSALLQRRMQQLNRGAPRLVDIDTDDPMKIALAELMAGKIEFAEGRDEATAAAGEGAPASAERAGETEPPPAAAELDLDLTLDEDEDVDE